ncbi:Hypothetical predicted protein [Mytilus galloprovincialis]|uniref:Uncharacterized protein n=1 Tax=Mytilus galloprovincialis TaxID=29158 RepID=A0A8B6CQP8_MYTGA|nr:Hypothetical predicted protein [Mytilus galloprovincialis]
MTLMITNNINDTIHRHPDEDGASYYFLIHWQGDLMHPYIIIFYVNKYITIINSECIHLRKFLDDLRQSISSDLTSFSNRLCTLENIANKSSSPVISLRPDHDIGSDLKDSDKEERFSVAPGSQEEGFTSDEDDNSVQVSQIVSQPSVPVSLSSSVIGQSSTNSGNEPETEDAPSSLKDLRDSVYTIMRDVNMVPFQSPPRPKKLTSTFEASCGLPVDDTKSHTSFPQSNHMSNSLQIINDGIVANESQFSQLVVFGLASFTEQFRSKGL